MTLHTECFCIEDLGLKIWDFTHQFVFEWWNVDRGFAGSKKGKIKLWGNAADAGYWSKTGKKDTPFFLRILLHIGDSVEIIRLLQIVYSDLEDI